MCIVTANVKIFTKNRNLASHVCRVRQTAEIPSELLSCNIHTCSVMAYFACFLRSITTNGRYSILIFYAWAHVMRCTEYNIQLLCTHACRSKSSQTICQALLMCNVPVGACLLCISIAMHHGCIQRYETSHMFAALKLPRDSIEFHVRQLHRPVGAYEASKISSIRIFDLKQRTWFCLHNMQSLVTSIVRSPKTSVFLLKCYRSGISYAVMSIDDWLDTLQTHDNRNIH